MDLQVVYEDNHLLAVNKAAGVLVQSDPSGEPALEDAVKKYLAEKYNKPGEVFLGVIHRLDRPVSGLVLFARTSKALVRMNEKFRERDIKKTYWAVVTAPPAKDSDVLIHYLKRDAKKNKTFVSRSPEGAQLCQLEYTLKGQSDRYFLLEVKPLTGRHHQIRAQLAAMGCPIKGDLKYGAPRSNEGGFIHLHARSLSFQHPVTQAELCIEAPLPDTDPLWKFFAQQQGG